MTGEMLTPEQKRVVEHPLGRHARVLAVAGSGKTTTMVQRVKYIVETLGVAPGSIRILMFNKRARAQFREKLSAVLPENRRPSVDSFHSFAYGLLMTASRRGWIASMSEVWGEDKEELVRRTVHRAIQNLEKQRAVPPEMVDPDDALESISLWKGSLITPERAGHRRNQHLPLVYAEYERLRLEKNALTFDDFVPYAVGLLEAQAGLYDKLLSQSSVVIVDEYQDVNYGQQRLIELVAGDTADVMVVGDDDQTIYEWRGARPNYIIKEFGKAFSNKPVVDYTLSRTFRFGPVLAQASQNVISLNTARVEKRLIAHKISLHTGIDLQHNDAANQVDVNNELARQVKALVKQTNDPANIAVLFRMYAQSIGLEAAFLANNIPYRVLGRAPFFKRREIEVLLDYLQVSIDLNTPVDDDACFKRLMSIVNVPNRQISRDHLDKARSWAGSRSLSSFLDYVESSDDSPLTRQSRQRMGELRTLLTRLNERIVTESSLNAGVLLQWLVKLIDYYEYFNNYYGSGEHSEDRKLAVATFCNYAESLAKTPGDFLAHIRRLDPAQGLPDDKVILMTTVFRVKGEEFDYVFIPDCEEGYMPCLFVTEEEIFDTRGLITSPPSSDAISNERRLFYVALTRARRMVFIGATTQESSANSVEGQPAAASRFIAEMLLGPTIEVMGAFQRLAAGDRSAIVRLSAAAIAHAGRKAIMANLLEEYLPATEHSLPMGLLNSIRGVPELPPPMYVPPPSLPNDRASASSEHQRSAPPPKEWWDE
ncbi:MAG: ATP-dependent helicase [Phototrophicaceae bacterium]